MNEGPVVSVLCSTLCEDDWVDSLKSVLSQKGVTFELVLVVDGPVDPGAEGQLASLLNDYPNIRLIRNELRLGLTVSLNKAAAVAQGRVFVRHDDDDFSNPGRLNELVRLLGEIGVDLVASCALASNAGSDRTWELQSPQSDAAIKERLESGNCLNHSTIAIRATFFREIGGYDETFRYAQDFALYLRIVRSGGTFHCTDKLLVTRVFRDSSITVKKRKVQMLYSYAALVLHNAEREKPARILRITAAFLIKFLTPNTLRRWKRKLSAHSA